MKKIVYVGVIIISIFIINNFVRSIVNLWSKQDILVKAQKELIDKKRENEDLKKKLSVVESQEFLEKEARNKLLMVKPGEKQVLISQELLNSTDSAKEKSEENKPNWQKWWELFFN
ncbi:hypothetical protein C4559_01135 [Candidatus Microgenomates bacterium]|nr:MAG: hypothetical protein C4559_01135 [Candidatus Microgenomates bacterium]